MDLNYIGLLIFVLSYIGIALGRIPGLAIDRTGVALLGAMLMIVFHVVNVSDAVHSIDYSTLILLFGLMLLSTQYDLGGFYTKIADKAAKGDISPKKFMALLIVISGGLSALLSNDVICFAMTPLVAKITMDRKWNAIPFLLALVVASNVGSAITIIGNPQNMLIGQQAHLNFATFLLWCGPPSVISLGVLYGWSIWRSPLVDKSIGGVSEIYSEEKLSFSEGWNQRQTSKAVILTIAMIILFFTPIPREITVLGVAAILLMSRKFTTSRFLKQVDWPLLVLFIALFILIAGFRTSGGMVIINHFLETKGVGLFHPVTFSVISVALSNLVSNVPAVILLMADLPVHVPHLAFLLALTSTYAGNLIIIGSIANLIVIQQAKQVGITIKFRHHFEWAAPFAILSISIAVCWWLFLS